MNGEKNFVVVKHLDQHTAIISHGNNTSWQSASGDAFLQKVTGTVLLAAATADSGEQNYQAVRRKTLQQKDLIDSSFILPFDTLQFFHFTGISSCGQTTWLAGLLLFLKPVWLLYQRIADLV